MNQQSYKAEHLQDNTGILTNHDTHNGKFKMELRVEDNSILERSIEEIIEINFLKGDSYRILERI